MKLVPKLTLALLLVPLVLLAVNGYLRVRREVGFFEADRVRAHEMLGRAVGEAVVAVWKSEGQAAASRSLGAMDARFSTVRIRWVDAGHWDGAAADAASLANAPAGEPVTRVLRGAESRWFTYVPIDVNGTRRGAIELSEEATRERGYAHSTVVDTLVTAAALAVLGGLLSWALGQWLVGVPIGVLADKARRIGRGDFGEPVMMNRPDELGDLAREMNRMCERLSTTLDQLRHADRLTTVGKLASGVAHELGTPLNVVAVRADMIARGATTAEESQTYARVITGSAAKMTKIIRQLLQFARRTGPKKAEHDIRELAEETATLLQPLADKRSVRIEVSQREPMRHVFVDGGQVQQVLTNLLMNAMQAMKKGGTVSVVCSTETALPPADLPATDGEYAIVRVKDEGSGIAPDDLPRVFEPFFTTKDVGEGTGLGLAVSYGIIHDHGGWIAVESVPGEGSMFSVYVPVASA